MNDIVRRMIDTQLLLFLYMLCGYIVSRLNILREDNREVLVRLLMDVVMPMMVLNAFNKLVSPEELRASLLVMVIAAAGCFLTWGLGILLWRKQPERKKKVLMYATMFSNAGNAGLPVLNLVFGSEGVFFGSMYLIPPRILQWTVGMSFFLKPTRKTLVRKVLLNPMVVVVYIGFLLMAFRWQIPGVFGTAVARLGDMAGPLSMILIGATLSRMRFKALLDPSVLLASALRLLVIPVAVALILKAFAVDRMTLDLCVILLAMPIASNTAAMAERYGGDYAFASACVSVSTLLSVVTVPVITFFCQQL